ncbi:MAG: isoprenyl transferase [Prevotella sp.]|jgi:undecaprenyl diphosphate synthase|nr:isoprenyl transferase [Prevotella sp.]
MDKNNIPQHIAIIMDGNGRWATAKGKPRSYGHQAGVETVTRIATDCAQIGVKYLTLYAFSTENWNRPIDEVSALMGLVLTALEEEIFMRNDIRFRVIGDRSRLPKDVNKKLADVEERTAANKTMTLIAALSYSSKWEITDAVKQIAQKVNAGELAAEDISDRTIDEHLQTAGIPDPDLLIRTGGEQRISNYLLWQIAYSELYFTNIYWPDFNEEHLHLAIEDYQKRQRRYGKTEEQIENETK